MKASVLALAAVGPALLLLVPTPPVRRPVPVEVAAVGGVVVGAVLFAVLARHRPRMLVTPISIGAAFVVAGVGMSEEATWRAFVLARLAPVAGLWPAAAVTTVGFAATHVPALRMRGAIVQVLTGAVFGSLFVATGSLVACALAHGAYNVLAVLGRTRPAAAVTFRRTEKRFGGRVALHPLDLTIERGELVAIVGPNGAGKTTLANLLLGLRRPDRGDVRVFGRDPRHWRARSAIGSTLQDMGFPPTLRAREILELARAHSPSPPTVSQLVDRFDLTDVVNRRTGALSGGQRRRLTLALPFAGSPDLVVLDEPTTGLDVEARRHAWGAIAAFGAEGGTVLLATNQLDEADALAQRIVVLSKGTVLADGPRASLGPDLERTFLELTRA
jgi:ABC-2 type transport system ATP-binding protein